jgi:hypothetical protein
MRLVRAILPLLVLAALAGCTPKINVKVTLVGGQPVLTFLSGGYFPRRLDSICLWTVEVIDDVSDSVALKVLASDYERKCSDVSQVTLSRLEPGLMKASQTRDLFRGRTYHVEVTADEGVGRSPTWRQP